MKIKQLVGKQLIAFIAAFACYAGGSAIWNAAADVVWFEKATPALAYKEGKWVPKVVPPGTIHLAIQGYKVRECIFIGDSQLGYIQYKNRQGDVVRTEADFQFLNDKTPNSTRPWSWLHRQHFGIWEWKDQAPPHKVTHVLATVGHDCGAAGLRTTTIGPFKLPQEQS